MRKKAKPFPGEAEKEKEEKKKAEVTWLTKVFIELFGINPMKAIRKKIGFWKYRKKVREKRRAREKESRMDERIEKRERRQGRREFRRQERSDAMERQRKENFKMDVFWKNRDENMTAYRELLGGIAGCILVIAGIFLLLSVVSFGVNIHWYKTGFYTVGATTNSLAKLAFNKSFVFGEASSKVYLFRNGLCLLLMFIFLGIAKLIERRENIYYSIYNYATGVLFFKGRIVHHTNEILRYTDIPCLEKSENQRLASHADLNLHDPATFKAPPFVDGRRAKHVLDLKNELREYLAKFDSFYPEDMKKQLSDVEYYFYKKFSSPYVVETAFLFYTRVSKENRNALEIARSLVN